MPLALASDILLPATTAPFVLPAPAGVLLRLLRLLSMTACAVVLPFALQAGCIQAAINLVCELRQARRQKFEHRPSEANEQEPREDSTWHIDSFHVELVRKVSACVAGEYGCGVLTVWCEDEVAMLVEICAEGYCIARIRLDYSALRTHPFFFPPWGLYDSPAEPSQHRSLCKPDLWS
ncbi:hypothetical protein B0H17DRAFT_1050392 [Mycena rosella]|uniref:Uncharacterized protein n=1 Tax=Mycena rosella TaxID=1033263 RepID=A0AAD7GK97_MYCRO|nr:hypothetical protein B0H17DRAFT_1050392 [Mycena rosella]